MRKQYHLRWTTGTESITAMNRFFDTSLTLQSMIARVKRMIEILPKNMALVIRHALLTGLRCSEAVESIRLIRDKEAFTQYYNADTATLCHYKFKEQFLRSTKRHASTLLYPLLFP
jgi:hypothetical protein